MKNLRLLLFEKCNRSCEGCCNKQFDLTSLPVPDTFIGYKDIILTGGEPLLNPGLVIRTIKKIKRQNKNAAVYVYTAKSDIPEDILGILHYADGIILTLHNQNDVSSFKVLNSILRSFPIKKSLRLNVFKDIDLGKTDLSLWKVKKDIVWIKDCPLPENEVFMRLERK